MHSSDTQTHNDGSQVTTRLGIRFTNTFFGAWASEYVGTGTRPDQSGDGARHRLSTGGSWAAIMGNASGGTVVHCTVAINLVDPAPASGTWSIRRSVFWNDMSAGRPIDSTAKGTAIPIRSDRTYDIPTSGGDANHWFDGAVLTPTVR